MSAEENEYLSMRLPVIGAGELIIAAPWKGDCRCGKAVGMHVGVTWGSHGEAGGVIDVSHLRELVDSISAWLEKYEELIKEKKGE